MALVKCPECGKDVSSEAKACPDCGYPVKEGLQAATSNEAEKPDESLSPESKRDSGYAEGDQFGRGAKENKQSRATALPPMPLAKPRTTVGQYIGFILLVLGLVSLCATLVFLSTYTLDGRPTGGHGYFDRGFGVVIILSVGGSVTFGLFSDRSFRVVSL